jgi:hypothetical protein
MPENFAPVFEGGGGITVWVNKTLAPRAWLVTDTRTVPDGIEALGAPEPGDAVSITGYSPNEITAQVDAAQSGYVVFSESLVPGWIAFVNEQPVQVVRANSLFRAVPVAAGQNRVRMVYDPWSFRLGALITGLTPVVVLVVLVSLVLVRRRKSVSPI